MPTPAAPTAPPLTAAQEALVTGNLGLVWFCVRKMPPSVRRGMGEDEDAAQIGMEALVRAARLWDGRQSKFATYAVTAIRRLLLRASQVQGVVKGSSCAFKNRLRQPGLYAAHLRAHAVRRLPVGYNAAVEADPDACTADDVAWMSGAVAKLPVEDRLLLRLRFWEGLELGDIGAALGLTKEGVRVRFKRILKTVRRLLKVAV